MYSTISIQLSIKTTQENTVTTAPEEHVPSIAKENFTITPEDNSVTSDTKDNIISCQLILQLPTTTMMKILISSLKMTPQMSAPI